MGGRFGSFGGALEVLKNVAGEVFGRMGTAANAFGAMVATVAYQMARDFVMAVNRMASAASQLFLTISKSFIDVPGMEAIAGTFGSIGRAAAGATRVIAREAILPLDDLAIASRATADTLIADATRPLESLAGLGSAVAEVGAEAVTATDSIRTMNSALDEAGGSGGPGGAKAKLSEIDKAAKAAAEQAQKDLEAALEESERKAHETADSIKGSLTEGFKGIITGAQSMGDALGGIFASLADMAFNNFGDAIFGGLSKAIAPIFGPVPGFANGTNYAPGGMAWVGERGPELVNLPRGSQVIPNNELSNSAQSMHVTVGVSADSNGNLMPFVQNVVQSGIGQNNAQRDQAFVGKVNSTQANTHWRQR